MTSFGEYWGIDPGLSGAIAIMRPSGLDVFDMPTHALVTNRKKRRKLDLHALSRLISVNGQFCRLCLVEDVHAMPKQGVSSSFSFGFTAGAIQGLLAGHGVPFRLVHPNVWKRQFGLTADKDASRRVASQRLPAFSHLWCHRKDDGRAEAALLALHASEMAQQQVAA